MRELARVFCIFASISLLLLSFPILLSIGMMFSLILFDGSIGIRDITLVVAFLFVVSVVLYLVTKKNDESNKEVNNGRSYSREVS